jgi:deazaflavin-dependent oxidoreductase (nitroreductase family)
MNHRMNATLLVFSIAIPTCGRMMRERADVQYLYLTTTGRRTGLPREIEIWFTERDGRFYIIAEHGERANWVRNIQANRRVLVRVGELQLNGTARLVDPAREPELALAVKALSDAKYGWSNGLVAEISPDD